MTVVHILVVEDDDQDYDTIRSVLMKLNGHLRLHRTQNLADTKAFLLACQDPVDIILLDLSLPDGQGLTTLSHLADFTKERIPIIAMNQLQGKNDDSMRLPVFTGPITYFDKARGEELVAYIIDALHTRRTLKALDDEIRDKLDRFLGYAKGVNKALETYQKQTTLRLQNIERWIRLQKESWTARKKYFWGVVGTAFTALIAALVHLLIMSLSK